MSAQKHTRATERGSPQKARTGGKRLAVRVFRVGAPTLLRIEAMRVKLSTRWRPVATPADAYRASLLMGLASLADASARLRWPLRDLRRLATDRLGPGAKDASLRLDESTERQVEMVRERLSTRSRPIATSAALRTLVVIGLDGAAPLSLEEIGRTLARSSRKAAS